jgi:recombination protein RecR
MNDIFGRLHELFMRFPGIGPRQAKRFAFFLLHVNDSFRQELVKLINELPHSIKQCTDCFRFFPAHDESTLATCELCRARDDETLLVCEKDVDLEALERAGAYTGKYFVLGGLVPILEKEPQKKIRERELLERINRSKGLKEIILALSANTDGDATISYLQKRLADVLQKNQIRLTLLGRGLSTGTELEYSDSDTIRSALKNRG